MASYEVTVNGRIVRVEAVSRNGTHISFTVADKRYDVDVSQVRAIPHPTAVTQLSPASTLPAPAVRTSTPKSRANINQVVAPMPGIVTNILVAQGQSVTPGQPVAVIEAMKMENNITAPRAGVIENVHVKIGLEVENAQLLVSFVPEGM